MVVRKNIGLGFKSITLTLLLNITINIDSNGINLGSNTVMAEECPPGYDCMTVSPDPSMGMGGGGSGGGGIIYPGSGSGVGSGGSGSGGGGGSSSAEEQRVREYSECMKRAEAGRQPCINDRNSAINFAADICGLDATVAGGVAGVYLSPLTGVLVGGLSLAACIGAKHYDLSQVGSYCASQIATQKTACG